jgi:hypothetical protein
MMECSDDVITIHVPLKIVVRGGRKTVVGASMEKADRPPKTRFDNSIAKALGQAHRWRSLIEGGTYGSISELARDRGINKSYACRVLRLSLLSPVFVEQLLNREHPGVTLDRLLRPNSFIWSEQMPARLGRPPHQG